MWTLSVKALLKYHHRTFSEAKKYRCFEATVIIEKPSQPQVAAVNVFDMACVWQIDEREETLLQVKDAKLQVLDAKLQVLEAKLRASELEVARLRATGTSLQPVEVEVPKVYYKLSVEAESMKVEEMDGKIRSSSINPHP